MLDDYDKEAEKAFERLVALVRLVKEMREAQAGLLEGYYRPDDLERAQELEARVDAMVKEEGRNA